MLHQNKFGGRVVVTADAMAGSSGKGCLNAWLADKRLSGVEFDIATNNWATNAGHFVQYYIERDKRPHGIQHLPSLLGPDQTTRELEVVRILNQHICSSFVCPNTLIYINAGSSIDLEVLNKEIETIESFGYDIKSRLKIHPHANVITERDKEIEKNTITSGSTFKGCGAALARKSIREPGCKLAKDYDELAPYIKDMTMDLNDGIRKGMDILVEGSQGVDLDINHAEYPYTTSRQTHPSQLIADAGLPPNSVTNIIMNMRAHPIRINNTSAADGEHRYTGNYWDADETSWETIALESGYESYEEFIKDYEFALLTSVTKKIRRVFKFPVERMKYVNALVGGGLDDGVVKYAINFLNFVDRKTYGVTEYEKVMTPKVVTWLRENLYKVIAKKDLMIIRTGPFHHQSVTAADRWIL